MFNDQEGDDNHQQENEEEDEELEIAFSKKELLEQEGKKNKRQKQKQKMEKKANSNNREAQNQNKKNQNKKQLKGKNNSEGKILEEEVNELGLKKKRKDQEYLFSNILGNNSNELIQQCIDIIRHQEYILDNINHFHNQNNNSTNNNQNNQNRIFYNEKLLKIWSSQINLLDSYDRFQLYLNLGKLKGSLKKIQLMNPIVISQFVMSPENEIEEIISNIDLIIKSLTNDVKKKQLKEEVNFELKQFANCIFEKGFEEFSKLQNAFEKRKNDQSVFKIFEKSVILMKQKMMQLGQNIKGEQRKLIFYVLKFVFGIWKQDELSEDQDQWKCGICEFKNLDCSILLSHIQIKHLKFLLLLEGSKDKCLSLSCYFRKRKFNLQSYNHVCHLKESHSEIWQEEKFLIKFLFKDKEGLAQLNDRFYVKDKKNWKMNFKKDVLKFIRVLSEEKSDELEKSDILIQRGDKMPQDLKDWFYKQEGCENSILNHKMKSGGGGKGGKGGKKENIQNKNYFDQLCYLLKFTWNNAAILEDDVQELKFIFEKVNQKTLPNMRIIMLENIGELLDTKSSLLSQLHRYLLLGVFNFKLSLSELPFRIQHLEKLILNLGIFQAQVFNQQSSLLNNCIFKKILCHNQEEFKNLQQMYEHYFEAHTGIFYCLNSSKLKQDFGNEQNFLQQSLSKIMMYGYDNFGGDFKSRSKRFLRMCIKYFQVKGICCDCKKELNNFSEMYWKSNKLAATSKGGQAKYLKLELKHDISLREVIVIYDSEQRNWQEIGKQLEEKERMQMSKQIEKYKEDLFEEMKKEILIDDQGRLSQCKCCNKKNKPDNPLLKELKEEYFKLPFEHFQSAFKNCKLQKSNNAQLKMDFDNDNSNDDDDEVNNVQQQKQLKQQQQQQSINTEGENEAKYILVQRNILNRLEKEQQEQRGKKIQQNKNKGLIMDGGYFKIDSYPKLVNVYGNISESNSQNPRRVISQPILTGQMKVLFSTPLFYIPQTSIIYEMQANWKQTRIRFKLFGSSDVQRREMIEMLETHPIMSNHSYQLSRMTNLCVNQVDLMFKLNHHLFKQNKLFGKKLSIQQVKKKLNHELSKTSDLMYFEGVLHRSQIIFLVQQFKIWQEVFSNVIVQLQECVKEHQYQQAYQSNKNLLLKFKSEFEEWQAQSNDYFNFSLMLLLGIFYCVQVSQDDQFQFNLEKEMNENTNSSLFDFFVIDSPNNPIRFIIESHLQPIVSPIIGQFIHPLFIGVLLQIFQLKYIDDQEIKNPIKEEVKFHLQRVYQKLAKLSIKRCIPLYFEKNLNMDDDVKEGEVTEQAEESEEEKQRKEKWVKEQRWFQLELHNRLNLEERVDMQCRYVLAKRSLLKVMNSQICDSPIQCDLRWTMQVGQLFIDFLKQKQQDQDDDVSEEKQEATEHLNLLQELQEEIDHFFFNNNCTIPEDFLFQQYKKKSTNTKNQGKEEKQDEIITSDLRSILEKIIQEDQKRQINQYFDRNNYNWINKLKLAYYIPMEKKLQDIVKCIGKLRALPHKQAYRSYEKFHRYNFRELELLAFPELFPHGKGFQQFKAPNIERSIIVVGINKKDEEKASDMFYDMKQFKKQQQQNKQMSNFEEEENYQQQQQQQKQQRNKNKIVMNVEFQDFTSQLREGLDQIPKAKNAIFQLKREDYIRQELCSSFVYDLQNISVIKIFQEASESEEQKEKYFQLEQEIEIKIEGEVLSESITQKHVQENLGKMVKKQITWSNECKQFIRQITDDVMLQKQQQGNNNSLDSQIQQYIRVKEKLFLEYRNVEKQ